MGEAEGEKGRIGHSGEDRRKKIERTGTIYIYIYRGGIRRERKYFGKSIFRTRPVSHSVNLLLFRNPELSCIIRVILYE